jgi:hypothetical protein
LNFLQAEVIMHLLEIRKRRHVREDGTKVIEVLVQPVENIQDEDTVGDVNTEVDEGGGKEGWKQEAMCGLSCP